MGEPMTVPVPENEEERIAYLDRTGQLDSEDEEVFNAIVRLAQAHFRVPIVSITLIDRDRQWFKARCGLPSSETPRDISFCTHAIMDEEVMIVRDAAADERFADNPFVTGEPYIRFYAGAPIIMPAGIILGTLCLIDSEARNDFSPEQAEKLADMALIISHIIEMQITARAAKK